MKIIKILILSLFILTSKSFSKTEVEIDPININFYSIEKFNDTIAYLGDYGTIILLINNENYESVRVFQSGKVMSIIKRESKYYAFNELGIVKSAGKLNGKWEQVFDIKDSIRAVTLAENNFLIRNRNNILLLNDSLKQINSFNHFSRKIIEFNELPDFKDYPFMYKYSMTTFKDNIMIETGNGNLLKFDLKLNFIDTINLAEKMNAKSVITYLQNFSNIDYYYIRLQSNNNNKLCRTKDFINFDTLMVTNNYYSYKLINNKIYIANSLNVFTMNNFKTPFILFELNQNFKDSLKPIMSLNNELITNNLVYRDWDIIDNKFYSTGLNKLITINSLNDSTLNIISDFSNSNLFSIPEFINDSTFLFTSYSMVGECYQNLYKTDNKGVFIKPVINYKQFQDRVWNHPFSFKYFDTEKQMLYFGGDITYGLRQGIYSSKDLGNTFNFKSTPNIFFETYSYVNKIPSLANIKKIDNGFIHIGNSSPYGFNIYTLDNEFYIISKFFFKSDFLIDYVDSKDTNTFIVHGYNNSDSTIEIRYTKNKFANTELLKKYSKEVKCYYSKEILNNYDSLVFFIYFDKRDTSFFIDVLELSNNEINTVYYYKPYKIVNIYNLPFSITCDSTNIYLTTYDTLFVIKNIYSKNDWIPVILPNNGKIVGNLMKFNNYFFAAYEDTLNSRTSVWLKLTEKTDSIPIILVSDIDFGKKSINDTLGIIKQINISNLSSVSDLVITDYSRLVNSDFSFKLPEISKTNPLIIKPNNNFEFEIKFNPKLIKQYYDTISFVSNAGLYDNKAILFGQGIDSITSVVDKKIENQNYLYAYPGYPVPSNTGFVKSLIYWDTSIDIDKAKITITNITGEIINTYHKLSIEKNNNFNGNLIWDCRNMPSGSYFIKIEHGSASVTLKVMVD